MRSAELILDIAGRMNTTSYEERRAINRLFRDQDESDKWPISGKFNATERAIRQYRFFANQTGNHLDNYEYCLFIEEAISRIVNDKRNW